MPFLSDTNHELRTLNRYEKQIIALTVCGAFFSCFDFTLYFFFNDAINQAFFPNANADWLGSSGFLLLILLGYISRPLGGIVLSNIGDKLGRKRIMMLSLFVVSIPTLLISILPTYSQIGVWALVLLMILRFIQGFGFGAEVPASWVWLAEHMPRYHIGSVCGMLIGSFILSVLVSNILSTMLSSMLTPEQMTHIGWRIPFLIGGLGTVVAISLRRRIAETPLWLNAQAEGKLSHGLPLKTVFQHHRFSLMMSFGLSWFTSSVVILAFLVMPQLGINFFDVSESLMSISLGIGSFFAIIGTLVFGYCVDRYNSGRIFGFGCILLAASCLLLFAILKTGSELLLLSYAFFGFSVGIIGIVPSICVRLFPVEVRMSGLGFSYNVAYAITGALTPYVMIQASQVLNIASMLYMVFLSVIGVIMSLFLSNLQGLYRLEDKQTSKNVLTR